MIGSTTPSTPYQVLFYLDFNASISDMRCYHALQHLAEIAPFIRVIGTYPREAVFLGKSNEDGRLWREVLHPLAPSSPLPRSQRLRVGIVGYGRFGRFLLNHLRNDHNDVWTINLREGEDFLQEAVDNGLVPDKTYFQAITHQLRPLNFLQGFDNISKFLSNNLDVIVFTVSVLSFEQVLTAFVPHLKSELVVDVLSVKVHPYQLMKKMLPETCDVLCSHPMFGPDSGKDSWVGLPFMYHKIRVKVILFSFFISYFVGFSQMCSILVLLRG